MMNDKRELLSKSATKLQAKAENSIADIHHRPSNHDQASCSASSTCSSSHHENEEEVKLMVEEKRAYNRKNSARHRKRVKDQITTLITQVDSYKTKCMQLQREKDELESMNKRMRKEIDQIRRQSSADADASNESFLLGARFHPSSQSPADRQLSGLLQQYMATGGSFLPLDGAAGLQQHQSYESRVMKQVQGMMDATTAAQQAVAQVHPSIGLLSSTIGCQLPLPLPQLSMPPTDTERGLQLLRALEGAQHTKTPSIDNNDV